MQPCVAKLQINDLDIVLHVAILENFLFKFIVMGKVRFHISAHNLYVTLKSRDIITPYFEESAKESEEFSQS